MQSNKMFLRLFGMEGCQHCQQATSFLINRGIPFQYIIAWNDPVVNQGVTLVTGKPSYPVLVVFAEGRGEVLSGFNPEQYERIANDYIQSCSSTVAPNAPSNEGNNIQQTASVVNEQEQKIEGTV